jgi:hypothetical protein
MSCYIEEPQWIFCPICQKRLLDYSETDCKNDLGFPYQMRKYLCDQCKVTIIFHGRWK